MENIKINITSNGTTTLATAGKYCERNVDIDVLVSGGGGGSSFLDSEGSLFMTADEEAFCVDGNDRLFDVETFPENPNENLVYKKTEKNTVSDGQLTYINETTTYGIPVQTDHSNGLHHKNVEVFQHMGEGDEPHAYLRFTLDQTAVEFIEVFASLGLRYKGYKVIDNMTEWDKNPSYVYLVRSTNEIVHYQGGWERREAEQVNDPSEMTKFYGIYYGKESGWQSLSVVEDYKEKYIKALRTLNTLLDESITEIECDAKVVRKSVGGSKLKIAKLYSDSIASSFGSCSAMTTLITTADSVYDVPTQSFYCFVLSGSTVCNVADNGPTANNLLSNCYHFDGIVHETYNPEGLKDGYIYVPLSLIDSYKASNKWSMRADQIMPIVKDTNELYKLDTSIYTIAYVASAEMEVKYDGTWKSLR